MNFKQLVGLFLLLFAISCSTGLERALNSGDKDLMKNTAQELYDKGKYDEAVLLYDKLSSYLTTVDEIGDNTYKTALANMKAENYTTAAHQFSVYNVNYPTSPLAEEALYFSAISLYNLSPEYNLDPTNTKEAIDRLQTFISTYPDSEKKIEINKKIEELRDKLEKKAYEKAMLHFNITNYKSSSVEFKNFLEEYPDSIKKEDALYFIFKSDYNVSVLSVKEKKEERIKNALLSYKKFISSFPESAYKNEVDKLKDKLTEEQKQVITL